MARTAKLKTLTDKAVKAYVQASDKSKPLHDGGGLYLRARDAGAYWYLRLTDPATNAQQWHRMFPDDPAGHYPHKTLADAREEADKLWRKRSEGFDPRALRQQQIADRDARAREAAEAERRRISVKDLFDHWARVELAPHTLADGQRRGRKDGGEYIRQQFERRIFPALGAVAVADVRKADVLRVLDEVTAAGKLRTANVLLASLKQMFRFALAREFVERNPLDTVTKRDAGGKEAERERTLGADELIALPGLLANANITRAVLRLYG
jgi:Arm DNA-binding domain